MNATKTALKYSFFFPALTRALKETGAISGSGGRIHCNIDDDGMIYVCTGYFAVKLTAPEYDALVRPVTQRDAGKWVLNEYGDTTPDPIDIPKIIDNAAKDAAHTIAAAPMFFDMSKGKKSKSNAPQLVGYYSESGDFVTAFNSHYAAIVSPSLERKSKGSSSPMVVYSGDSPIAIILPVKVDADSPTARAVRAWFTDDDTASSEQTAPGENVERLIRENDQLRRDCEAAKKHNGDLIRRIDELQGQMKAMTEHMNAQPDPQPQEAAADVQPQDKTAALVEKLATLPGVTATVKGAQTAAPVVWLTGEADAHADEIKQMGGKWSGKRGAWYFTI